LTDFKKWFNFAAAFAVRRKARGAVAQLVEHRTENPGVGGSTPPRTTNRKREAQLVEHPAFFFEKSGKNPGVGGSTPPRTTNRKREAQLVEHPAFFFEKSGKNPGVGGSTPPRTTNH
jgi:hypothetical protein